MIVFLLANWLKLIGVAGGLFGVWKYFDSRKQELKWKKTEFLFSESKYFANDDDLSECVQILEGRHPKYTISDIYPDSDDGPPEILEYRHKFEKLLNFFDRLAYALFNQQTIKEKDVAYYGWYLQLLYDNKDIVEYCNTYGFDDVIKLARTITERC